MKLYCTEEPFIKYNGGVSDDIGYYGWVIAKSTSIIWEDSDQVPGNAMEIDSLCAESGDMLMF